MPSSSSVPPNACSRCVFEEQITDDSVKCCSKLFVVPLKRDVRMLHPRCSTPLLILDGRQATVLSLMVLVVVGGTTGVLLLI